MNVEFIPQTYTCRLSSSQIVSQAKQAFLFPVRKLGVDFGLRQEPETERI